MEIGISLNMAESRVALLLLDEALPMRAFYYLPFLTSFHLIKSITTALLLKDMTELRYSYSTGGVFGPFST